MNEDAKRWIDRYSAEVGNMLPAARREDIVMEIRSLLMDELEGRPGNGPSTEEDVLALLRDYPSPTEMAARYGAPRSLIGPTLYPTYLKVARLVGLIVGSVTIGGLLLALFTEGPAELSSILGVLGSTVGNMVVAVAIVTLVFAMVERAATPNELAEMEKLNQRGWRPESLLPVERHEQVSVSDMVTEIVTTLVSILWLNLYVTSEGAITIFSQQAQSSFLLFSPLFLTFIPWLTLLWIGDLITSIVVLARRRWERASRLVIIVLGGAESLVLGWMLTAGPLAATPWLEPWIRGGVAVVLIITLAQLAGHLWGLYRQLRQPKALGLTMGDRVV